MLCGDRRQILLKGQSKFCNDLQVSLYELQVPPGRTMRKIALAVMAVIAIISSIGSAVWPFPNFGTTYSGTPESITIGYSPFEHTALLYVADDQHFFSQNGLNVTLRRYDSGVASLDGMLDGEVDIAVGVTEFPLVGRAFQKERIRTIGSIDKGEIIYLVGRKDRGIENVTDLKGKRVGTVFRTISEFYLGRFLELHGINMQDITLVDVKTPEEWVNAIVDGDIDAIATGQPAVNSIKDRLGDNAVVWSAQSNQPLYAMAISTDEWIQQHPELIARFLKSLAEAEEYVNTHPAESKAIVQKRLNLSADYMDTVWKQNQFTLSLDQSLVLAMEDEARWMIRNNLTTERQVPNFLDYIQEDDLKAIKPDSVNIIR
jgi:NitT/TauT family transport system substrate-binding protein